MDWNQFTSIPNGTQVKNHLYDQCVALANLFHESVIGEPFVPVDSAFEWWTRFWEFPQLRNVYTQSASPAEGALFVAKGGIYDGINGHIGVVTGVGNGGFYTMEQNTGPYWPQRYVYRYWRLNDNNVLGFLIPKDNPAQEDELNAEDRALLVKINADNQRILAVQEKLPARLLTYKFKSKSGRETSLRGLATTYASDRIVQKRLFKRDVRRFTKIYSLLDKIIALLETKEKK